jgi:hypothetical protein
MFPHVSKALLAALCVVSLHAFPCPFPDEGNMPLRRAVTRVDLLPETIAWSTAERRDGVIVHFAVLLEETISANGRCHWTLEARAGERVWQRFYITPDGKSLLVQGVSGAPVTLPQWRGREPLPAPSPPKATTAGSP